MERKDWFERIEEAVEFKNQLLKRIEIAECFAGVDDNQLPSGGIDIAPMVVYRRQGENHLVYCYGPKDFAYQNASAGRV